MRDGPSQAMKRQVKTKSSGLALSCFTMMVLLKCIQHPTVSRVVLSSWHRHFCRCLRVAPVEVHMYAFHGNHRKRSSMASLEYIPQDILYPLPIGVRLTW